MKFRKKISENLFTQERGLHVKSVSLWVGIVMVLSCVFVGCSDAPVQTDTTVYADTPITEMPAWTEEYSTALTKGGKEPLADFFESYLSQASDEDVAAMVANFGPRLTRGAVLLRLSHVLNQLQRFDEAASRYEELANHPESPVSPLEARYYARLSEHKIGIEKGLTTDITDLQAVYDSVALLEGSGDDGFAANLNYKLAFLAYRLDQHQESLSRLQTLLTDTSPGAANFLSKTSEFRPNVLFMAVVVAVNVGDTESAGIFLEELAQNPDWTEFSTKANSYANQGGNYE